MRTLIPSRATTSIPQHPVEVVTSVASPTAGESTDTTLCVRLQLLCEPSLLFSSSNAAGRTTTPTDWAPSPDAPPPDAHHPNFSGAGHVPVDVLEYVIRLRMCSSLTLHRRSLDFLKMNDRINHRYAISNIPDAAKWGNRYESEKYLCVHNQRITVWLVGVVKNTWFTGEGGKPAARVSIGVHLPYDGDIPALQKVFANSRPVSSTCFRSTHSVLLVN